MNLWIVLSADLRDSVQSPVFYPKSERENTTKSQALDVRKSPRLQESVPTNNILCGWADLFCLAYKMKLSINTTNRETQIVMGYIPSQLSETS